MKNTCCLFACLLALLFASAQRPADTGTLILHKFSQPIGRETYIIHRTGGTLDYEIHFKFTDRSQDVPLEARLRTTAAGEPLGLLIKGSTSRFSTINDSIAISNKTATIRQDDSLFTRRITPAMFPVGGYSPGTVQMALLQYWKAHRRPPQIDLLPAGSVRIKPLGTDSLRVNDRPLLLECYAISGLIWGNELLWCSADGQLVCLLTNDAEGDKVEMVHEKYEALLGRFVTRAATLGMKLFAAGTNGVSASKAKVLAITGATLIDVTGGPSIPNSLVLVENGRIAKIGTAGTLAIPAGARVIHAEGKTLMPGLWDMHAHFQQSEWGPAYLAAGVTTVRDCGNELEYIDAIKSAIDEGRGPGPHILKAGIIDGPGNMALGIIRARNRQEALAAVRRYKEDGFVQIKIYSSIEPDMLKVICDEAHRLGLSVTGHIPESMGLIQSLDSGMNQVNHIMYVCYALNRKADRSLNLDDSTAHAVIAYLRTHGTVVDPTLGVFEMAFRSVKDDITLIEPPFRTLPQPLQALFKNMGMPPEQAAKYKPMMLAFRQMVKVLYDAGVPIVAGTDMGFPGHSLHRELEIYVEAGLTPLQAIQCATVTPAKVMGRYDAVGSIEPGKAADLLILDGNPLENIANLRKTWLVIKDGQDYNPRALGRMVGFGQ